MCVSFVTKGFKLRCGEATTDNLAVIISMVFEIEMEFDQCSTLECVISKWN